MLERRPGAVDERPAAFYIILLIASHLEEAIRFLRACVFHHIVYCCKPGKRPLETGLRLVEIPYAA
jgi:hypothetical protein